MISPSMIVLPTLVLGPRPAIRETEHTALIGEANGSAYARPHDELRWQNQSLLQVIRAIDQSQLRLTPSDRSEEMLREARAGGMYGVDSSD